MGKHPNDRLQGTLDLLVLKSLAARRGIIIADTKFEFGLADGHGLGLVILQPTIPADGLHLRLLGRIQIPLDRGWRGKQNPVRRCSVHRHDCPWALCRGA